MPQQSFSHLCSLRDCLRQIVSDFIQAELVFGHGFPNALSEAWALVCHVLHLPMDDTREIFLEARLSQTEIHNIMNLATQRIHTRKPLAYLIGKTWLAGYRFRVEEGVIVPRSLLATPLSEGLMPWLSCENQVNSILELCCGSASVMIIAAEVFTEARVDGVDCDAQALALAQKNIEDYQLTNRIRLFQGDLFQALPAVDSNKRARYDLIIANPPYVPHKRMSALPAEYQAEPMLALDGGEEGLALIHRIIREAGYYLHHDGHVLLEIGGNIEVFLKTYPSLDPILINNDADEPAVLLIASENLKALMS